MSPWRNIARVFLSFVIVGATLGGSAQAARLLATDIEYLGRFEAPPASGSAKSQTWSWGMRGMSLIPDCLGFPDPTPSDGYPGCMGALGHAGGDQYGVFDLVPPGGEAQQVVPFWEVGAPLREQTWPGDPGSHSYLAAMYDKGEGYCRIWWSYGGTYTGRSEDKPFLAYSSCDPANPNPQGVWDFGAEAGEGNQGDPFQTSKMYQGLARIPAVIADSLFDGKQMMIGPGARSGTRGGSQGPALYVRDLEPPAPAPPGPVLDATPLVWYLLTGFVEWFDEPQMDGPVVKWWSQSRAYGTEFVSSPAGEAVILPWRQPTIDPNEYPCSDPYNPYSGDPDTPEPCQVPVCWYGLKSCEAAAGQPPAKSPSFWETERDGVTDMPVDCNISGFGNYLGMRCTNLDTFLIFYDVEELAQVYRGELEHFEPQPYARIPITLTGDLVQDNTAYDEAAQLLYVSQGGADPAIHVFQIGGQWQGSVCGDGFCDDGEECDCLADCEVCSAPDPCADGVYQLVIANEMIDSFSFRSACEQIRVGPEVMVMSPDGHLSLDAGESVVLLSGTAVALGGRLTITNGGRP